MAIFWSALPPILQTLILLFSRKRTKRIKSASSTLLMSSHNAPSAAASVVTDGEIMLSISTSGKSPATSRRIREYFEEVLNATSLYTLGYEDDKTDAD